MKTAEEILMEIAGYGYCPFVNTFTNVHKLHFIKAMKLYANAKLDEAA